MKYTGTEKNREIKHENVLTVQFSTMLSSCRETEELLLLKRNKFFELCLVHFYPPQSTSIHAMMRRAGMKSNLYYVPNFCILQQISLTHTSNFTESIS